MGACYRWSVVWVVAMALPFLSIAPSFALDPFWSTVLADWGFSSSGLHLSVLSVAADNGLQLASATALDQRGKGLRIGFGYDDMVSASRTALDGSNVPVAISDRMFLLTTRCDKRFQFMLQFSW
jgi:hypothetical protein